MAIYNPSADSLIFPAETSYTPPPGTNVVLDVVSGEEVTRYVAGTVAVSDAPAARELLVVSYHKQNIANVGQQHVVLASGTSLSTDGIFSINVGGFSGPVLVIALDDYGQTWLPNTAYGIGDIIHPADQTSYLGFVYECIEAGVSGGNEPVWWVDTGSNNTGTSGTATFKARQYHQPICHGPVHPLPKTDS